MELKNILNKTFSIRNKGGYKKLTILGKDFFIPCLKNEIRMLRSQVESMKYMMDSCCDITKCKKATGEFRLLQEVRGNVLFLVCDILEKNNVNYFLDFGTLIGAIRHKGFIPWDDDIDISVVGEDFYKAQDILNEALKDTDLYVDFGGYRASFILKVRDKVFKEMSYLDIFPYEYSDNVTDTVEELSEKILKVKTDFFNKYSRYGFWEGKYNMREKSGEMYEMYKKYGVTTKINEGQRVFKSIGALVKSDYLGIHNISNLFPLKKMEFEGRMLNVPNKSVEFLNDLGAYGDIMKFPALEDILCHHETMWYKKVDNFMDKLTKADKKVKSYLSDFGIL